MADVKKTVEAAAEVKATENKAAAPATKKEKLKTEEGYKYFL